MALPEEHPASAPPENSGDGRLTEQEKRRTIRKVGWRLMPVLAFAYFVNSIDKTNISLASLTMNRDLGLTEAAFGLASGLFFLGYFVFEVPSNVILYKVGPRRWITRIMVSWGVVSAATALVHGSGSLYAVRVLLGVAEAGFYPGVLLYLMFWFPTRYRGRMLAFFVLGGSLSGVFGNPLTGLILDHTDGLLGLSGWRMMFVLEGLPAIAVGVVALLVLRDRPVDAKWLTERERTWLTGELDAEQSLVHGRNAHAGSFRMITDIRVAMLSFVYFCKAVGQYGLTFFMPQMIVLFEAEAHHTYSATTVSLLTSVPALAAVLVAVPWAMHSDRTGERIWHSALPLFASTAGLCAAAAFDRPVAIMVALCVASMGIGTMSQAFFQIPGQFLTGMAAAGGLALINAVGNLGGFVSPYATGWLKDTTGTFSTACYVMGAVMAVGGFGILAFPRVARRKAHTELLRKAHTHA
ncbi:MFS transporter [Streptomyces sulfonofaciens]|uniref:MFS transporter n=1 Tax=Streptomyces sulfonofaciens TaxID=68272 RepID=A0A919FVW6_9ACTN|nr:MFS transporter [Streptomyces sulfonofaciens]GHH72525.1 MFS transporter [Streptomyces sulfonofaciens]